MNRRDAETQREKGGERLSGEIISACIAIHRALGPGLLESAYEECLCYELSKRGVPFERQVPVPVVYGEVRLDCGYRLDLVVEDKIIVELKTVETLLPIHEAQILTYLKLTNRTLGLLINFYVPALKDGVRRIVHNHPSPPISAPLRLCGSNLL